MSATDIADWDATETATAIKSGAVSALEVVDAAIARSESLNPKLNFLVTDDYERARDRARAPLGDGPFAGVPFLIKDLDDLAGLPTLHHRARHTDPLRCWAQKLIETKPFKLVAVATANKLARIAYAVMTTGTLYRAANA